MRFLKFPVPFAVTAICCLGCHKDHPAPPPPPPPSSDKTITSFQLDKSANAGIVDKDIYGTISGDTIRLSIPAQSPLNNITPDISITGKAITPASGVAQNFSKPVSYTVTAQDGSSRTYIVIVKYRRTIYLADGAGKLNAVDAATGQSLWTFSANNTAFGAPALSAPTAGGGKVYMASEEGLYAVDALTGKQVWKMSLPATRGSYNFPIAIPLLAGGVIYGSFIDGTVRALDAGTGQQKWAFQTTGAFYSSPTLYNNRIYTGGTDSFVYAIDAPTGTLQWKFHGAGPIGANPLVLNNLVYVGPIDTLHYYALSADNGALVWDQPYNVWYNSAVGLNGTIYCSQYNALTSFDPATGKLGWYINLDPFTGTTYNVFGSPYLAGGSIFIGSLDGNVYGFDLATHNRLWVFGSTNAAGGQAVSAFNSSPVVCKGVVYIGDFGGHLYGIGAADGKPVMQFNGNQSPSSVCIVDEEGVIYHPAESGEY